MNIKNIKIPFVLLLLQIPVLLFFCNLSLARDNKSSAGVIGKKEVVKWREDLRVMAEEMPKYHRNLFHQVKKEEFRKAINRLNKRIPLLSRQQIIIEMARITASIGDGHTNIAPTRDPKICFRSYPVKLYYFSHGLYVRSADQEHPDLPGMRIVKIGNLSVEEAYRRVCKIIGCDNEMGLKFFAPHLMVMPEVLNALGIIDDMDRADFTGEKGGIQKTFILKPSGKADMMMPDTDTSWIIKPGWTDLRSEKKEVTPLWLRRPADKFWFEYLPDQKTVYVQLNQIGNKDTETLEDFSKRLFTFVEANTVEKFILDLRLNRGGDGSLNRPLLLGIIKSKIDQKGKLFTIIGRSTWSAAQFLVNDLEKNTNTIFVGEPTGGKINSYGDSRKIILPNSGITVRVSSLWWQQDERDRRKWTAPQIAAVLSVEDYQNNIDPALEKILHYSPKPTLKELLNESFRENPVKPAYEVYMKWKSDIDNEFIDSEEQLNILGYELLSEKKYDLAIEVLKLCADFHPGSANANDSLGEAYLVAGDKELAAVYYKKALMLNPSLESSQRALKALGAK